MCSTPNATTLANDEAWRMLRARKTWGEHCPHERADAAREARENVADVHMRMMFGFVVEKNSDLPKGDAMRTRNGRVVPQ